MSSSISFVLIPKENVSDDTVLIARLHVAEGTAVMRGQLLGTIETSKAIIDIEAPVEGYVFFYSQEGERMPVGGKLAAVCDTPQRPSAVFAPIPQPTVSASESAGRISQAAKELIAEHGLAPALFAHLPLTRRQDVQSYLTARSVATDELARNLPPPKPSDVVIWGGGGHAKVCIEILRAMGEHTIYGILDAKMSIGSRVLGVPVVGREKDMEELCRRGVTSAVLGIGSVQAHSARARMLKRMKDAGYKLPNLIHPRACVEPSTRLGAGNVLFAHATVSSDVTISDGCIINSGAVVSHDCHLADNVHLAPGALLAGNVSVGENTLIGMSATVFLGTKIGRAVTINNGVAVMADVADGFLLRRS